MEKKGNIKAENPLCEVCNLKPQEQLHHLDENHKNNKPENLQHLCTLCHAKIHGIEPKYSELRYLVTLYTKCQKSRIAIENQIRGFSRIELETPQFFLDLIKQIEDEEKEYSKQIKKLLENGNHNKSVTHCFAVPKKEEKSHRRIANQPSNAFSSYPYLKSIKGISYLLAGRLMALVDLKLSPTVASLWCYAGQTPDSKLKKGRKANWNPELKMLCYQISDQFIKHRTPKYREIYDKEKAKQLKLLENAIGIKKPNTYLQPNSAEDKGENQCLLEQPPRECSPPSSKLHIEFRARRKAVKEFLKDYWINCKDDKNG